MRAWWMEGESFPRQHQKQKYTIRWQPQAIAESCERVDVPHLHYVKVYVTWEKSPYVFETIFVENFPCAELALGLEFYNRLKLDRKFLVEQLESMRMEQLL